MMLLNSQKNVSAHTNHAALVAGKFCLLSHHNVSWIIDSEATDHICHKLNMFTAYEPIDERDNYITTPNRGRVQVTGKGIVKLSEHVVLKNVLFMPSFHFKLISVPKLCLNNKCSVNFTSNACII